MAAVAAGLGAADEVVETLCRPGAARPVPHGQRPGGLAGWDGGGALRWRHTLYQEVVYDRVPVGRRVRLHRRIGARLEAGYGAQAGARAAELAEHFERGQDPQRAVPYLQQAADNAAAAPCVSGGHRALTRGLALLAHAPGDPGTGPAGARAAAWPSGPH